MHPQVRAVWLGEHDRCGITAHDPTNARRNRTQQFPKVQIGNNLVRQVKDQFQTVLCLAGQVKIHCRIDR